MVAKPAAQLDDVFGALADETRRQILARLMTGPASTTALAAPFEMSLPGVSKHLGVLERAGLIERQLIGRERRCRLVAAPLEDAALWLERYRAFWDHQLNRLADFFHEAEAEHTRWPITQPTHPSASPSPARSRRRRKKSSPRGRRPKR